MQNQDFVYCHWINCKQYIGKRPEVVKNLLTDVITECRYRAPSLLLLDDLDTLCHIPQDIANTAEENYLTSLTSIFCRVLLSDDNHGKTQSFVWIFWCALEERNTLI